MSKQRQQANQYDKILKENIEAVIPNLMRTVLSINAVVTEELPDDIQHTQERKPDVLKKVTDSEGDTFVLQIEFQVANDPDMVYRMAEYKVMLLRKYQVPVSQYVIFLGGSKLRMANELQSPGLSFQYSLLEIKAIDYTLFLNSEQPEEIVLSVLANFNKDSPENALKQIVHRLEKTVNGELTLKRYFNQLRVLAQLRKLEHKLKEIVMDSIEKYIDKERDVAFLIGLDKGQEKAKLLEQTKFITFLLQTGKYTLKQIAAIVGTSEAFVQAVQTKLSDKK